MNNTDLGCVRFLNIAPSHCGLMVLPSIIMAHLGQGEGVPCFQKEPGEVALLTTAPRGAVVPSATSPEEGCGLDSVSAGLHPLQAGRGSSRHQDPELRKNWLLKINWY